MSLSPIRQRYLDVYPLKFTPTIQPPFWFWSGLDGLTDTTSDEDVIAKALADYEEDKGALKGVRRELIEDIYIKAYPYKEDHEAGMPWLCMRADLGIFDDIGPCTVRIKDLTLDMSEAEIIARALADYEEDKSEIEMHNAYYQKMKDNEEE